MERETGRAKVAGILEELRTPEEIIGFDEHGLPDGAGHLSADCDRRGASGAGSAEAITKAGAVSALDATIAP